MIKTNDFNRKQGCVHLPELLTHKQPSRQYAEHTEALRTSGYYGIDDFEKFKIFTAIIKQFVSQASDHHRLHQLLEISDNFLPICSTTTAKLYESADELVEKVAKKKDCASHRAIEFIADRLGIKMEYCFKAFSEKQNNKSVSYIDKINYKSLIIDGSEYSCSYKIPVRTIDENIDYHVCVFSNHNRYFILPLARRINDQGVKCDSIGTQPVKACLVNRDEMRANPKLRILYFSDALSAIKANLLVQGSDTYLYTRNIVTFHYGCDAKIVNLDDLYQRKVVLFPIPTRDGMLRVVELYNRCIQAGAAKVQIYPYPIIAESCSELCSLDMDPLNDPWEREMLLNTITLDSEEQLSDMLKSIYEEACSIEEFISWGKDTGLFAIRSKLNQKSTRDIHASSSISWQNMTNVAGATRDYSNPVTIDEFCAPNLTSLFWGASDVGKSWIAISFCISIILGLGVFFLAPPKHKRRKYKVGYIDAEIGAVHIRPRIEQLCNTHNIPIDEVMSHFDVVDLNGKSLLNEGVQDEIITLACNNNWKAIMVDNIQACAPGATKGRSDDFFQFIAKMKNLGVNIVLLHHAVKEKGTYRGDGQLEDLSNCILRLQTASHDANLSKGAIITEVIVQKCKVDGNNLKNKSAKYMLPIGGTWEFLDGDLPNYHNLEQVHHEGTLPYEYLETKEEIIVDEKFVELVQALNPKEETLFNFVKNNKKVTRQMVQNAFKLTSRTAGNWLKNLADKDVIIMHGKTGSKNAYYTVAQ